MFDRLTPQLHDRLRKQLPQAKAASSGRVECECGKQVKLMAAYRCMHCGVWFCRSCGLEHFGPDVGPEATAT